MCLNQSPRRLLCRCNWKSGRAGERGFVSSLREPLGNVCCGEDVDDCDLVACECVREREDA